MSDQSGSKKAVITAAEKKSLHLTQWKRCQEGRSLEEICKCCLLGSNLPTMTTPASSMQNNWWLRLLLTLGFFR